MTWSTQFSECRFLCRVYAHAYNYCCHDDMFCRLATSTTETEELKHPQRGLKAKVEKRRRSYAGSLDMQLDASQPILLAYLLITPTSILVAVMMTCSAGLQHQQQKQRSFNIFKEAKAKVEKRRRSYAGSLEMQLDASQPILSAYLLITPTSILVAVMMTCSAGLQHQQQKQRSFNILKEAKAKVEKRRRSYAGSLEMQLDASQPILLAYL